MKNRVIFKEADDWREHKCPDCGKSPVSRGQGLYEVDSCCMKYLPFLACPAKERAIMEPFETPKTINREAEELVNGPRGEDYDSPEKNYERISKIASVLTGKDLTPLDCVDVMIATKLAREAHKHKRDNLVDLCGYAEIRNRMVSQKGVS